MLIRTSSVEGENRSGAAANRKVGGSTPPLDTRLDAVPRSICFTVSQAVDMLRPLGDNHPETVRCGCQTNGCVRECRQARELRGSADRADTG